MTDVFTASDSQAIGDIDSELIALLQRRRDLSHRIQRSRLTGGGRPTDHAVELQIVDRFRRELDQDGSRLAVLVLTICRLPLRSRPNLSPDAGPTS